MKNFPFIPLIMITVMVMVINHGHRMSRQSTAKAEYSMAAGVDAHLTAARAAFLKNDRGTFQRELSEAIELVAKEANCKSCIEKGIASESLPKLLDIKHQHAGESLELEAMDAVFGDVITNLAKTHILYTLEHLSELEDEFYLEDAIRHLKYSMKYVDEDMRKKEELATAALEEAITKHEIDEEKAKKALNDVVDGISSAQ